MPSYNKRRRNFDKWWRFNHHRSNAHVWLTKHAKRVAYGYMLPPAHHEDVQYICKRFNKSQHRRLKCCDAWNLWKVVHPVHRDRNNTITRSAEKLMILKDEIKVARAERKAATTDKKTIIEHRKRKQYAIHSK